MKSRSPSNDGLLMKSILASGKWCDSEVHITGELQSVKWKDIRRAWSHNTVLRRWIQPHSSPPPHIIMRNVGSRLLGNVAWGQAPQWNGQGKRRKKEARGSQKTFPPLQSNSSICSLQFEFKHLNTRPALPRARLAPLTRPKSPFRSFRAPATQANFLAVSPLYCLLLWTLVTGY